MWAPAPCQPPSHAHTKTEAIKQREPIPPFAFPHHSKPSPASPRRRLPPLTPWVAAWRSPPATRGAIYAFLSNSLGADVAIRQPAEAMLAQCETRPGFCSCLLEISAARGVAPLVDVRLLATVYFKNCIACYWRHRVDSP